MRFLALNLYICKTSISTINMSKQNIIYTHQIEKELEIQVEKLNPDKIFIISDSNTTKYCLPIIENMPILMSANLISIPSGDSNKNIDTLSFIWKNFSTLGASRNSLLINIGGGMVSDIGAFAASTFKRGMKCINIPTTLLAMVDASLGGKTGINFNGLKNEVGAFFEANAVLIDMQFLKTLDRENNLSGYAEMLKHGLIADVKHYNELLNFEFSTDCDLHLLSELVQESIEVKKEVVNNDPFEKGLRKILNLGHTIGHAFESFALHHDRPILHGYAVAWGLICELYIAHRLCNYPTEALRPIIDLIKERYGVFDINCKDYDELYNYILHDKKNTKGVGIVVMPLLKNRGDVVLDVTIEKDVLYESFDFYQDFIGI